MASRRILSNSNLAPIQELAVNPYNSFNSDSINKLTRIVSGGKDKDIVVNGLDVNSKTDKKWYAGSELLPALNDSSKWTGENYYVLDKTQDGLTDIDPIVHLVLPHENSYGFSYIKCKIDDSCVNHLYKSSYPKIYEVTFTLDFGTPKTIVAKINDCEVTIDHPESGKSYSLPLTKIFKNDTLTKGLTFTIGAVLDGADPECSMKTADNKTYIIVSHIGLRMKGYEFPEWSRSPGPIENEYAIYGIHPTHNIEITPGVAIKDDVMLEEMAPSIDKFKKFNLDLTSNLSWIKNNPFTISDFNKSGQTQYAYQCNDNGDVYKPRLCRFVDNKLQVCIKDHDNLDKWIEPTDDVVLTYDVDGNNLDRQFSFDRYTDDDEFHNFTLYSDGAVLDSVSSYSNTVIVCFLDDDGKYRIIGYKINVVKAGQGVKAPNISPNTPDVTDVNADDQAPNITFDNGSSFEIPILSYTLPKKISDYGDDWRNRIRGFVSIGPTKVSGDLKNSNYNSDMVQWGYVVLYYAYFKNPKPNTSYIGLIRESDLESNRDDYLVLAKVRFIDPSTVDIISYENRQVKQIPDAQNVEYYSTCDYPDIWDGDVPETVTDAINQLALYDHNFARMIRFKHDYDAPVDTSFNLANPDGRSPEKTPFIHVNNDGHLERKIRVDKTTLTLNTISESYARLLPDLNVQFTSDNDTTFKYVDSEEVEWRIRFNPNLNDIPLASDFGLAVCAAMGKYDSTSAKIAYSFVCFNNIGPFKFVDINNGKDVCEFDWSYYDDILVYPTSPAVSLDSQSLIYPTAPYSTVDEKGKYVDIDEGVLSGTKYLDTDNGLTGGRFLLSYDDPTDDNSSILNSRENHFSYLVFRNRLLISNYFLKMLDILPKRSLGKKTDGTYAYESLINKRILVGSDDGDEGNVHIESSAVELSNDLTNGNLLKNEEIDGVPTIQSSDYAIPNKKDSDTYSYENDDINKNYALTDNAVLTAKKRNSKTIDIISTKYELTAKGDGAVLSSVNSGTNDLVDIQSTKHSIDDDLINGNIIRAKVTDDGDKLESTSYAIPNKSSGEGNPYNLTYDFTNDSSESNYQLTDEALLMAKKRNDNTIDIISTKFTIQANDKGQVLISKPSSGLTSIESSRHYISDDLKNGNLVIAENPKSDDSNGDEIKSSVYSIPDTKSGAALNPMDSTYSYEGNGSYKLTDGALLTAKKRNDNTVDIISSKYTITAGGDNKIVVSEYQDSTDKINSLIEIKSSDYTIGDLIGHWYAPKVELRCDSWWNNGKPRIVVVIDTVHNFAIRVSEIVKQIHDQFINQYCYGDANITFDDETFKSIFNSDINVNNKWVCDITVVLDLTTGNARPTYLSDKDGYDVIESLCRSKLTLINDITSVTISGSTNTFKPYVKMYFDYSDSVKSEGGTIHYDEGNVVYGFDTATEFTGTHRSAEHLHSEPLVYVAEKWKLTDDYQTIDKNIIWKDEYRGYNNSKVYEEETLTGSQMNMYPVREKTNLNDTSASEYDPDDTTLQSGYGYCRGPLTYIYAGSKGEYTFNHIKTLFDPSDVVYPTGSGGQPLFTCTKCTDIIYGESKYYVTSGQF